MVKTYLLPCIITCFVVMISCYMQSTFRSDLFYAPILITILYPIVQILRDPSKYPLQFAPIIGVILGIPSGTVVTTWM
ncbi:hypothetical protein [Brevibacillus reuszeri]|uniref:hypothetical protein n=1 Tax=Brevibacillus reuszeri TaxID=54915 RepID=UPI000CCC780B|nr:hypothetical protein [Brevibacillus reuszeri]